MRNKALDFHIIPSHTRTVVLAQIQNTTAKKIENLIKDSGLTLEQYAGMAIEQKCNQDLAGATRKRMDLKLKRSEIGSHN